jgi:hypothetical protein
VPDTTDVTGDICYALAAYFGIPIGAARDVFVNLESYLIVPAELSADLQPHHVACALACLATGRPHTSIPNRLAECRGEVAAVWPEPAKRRRAVTGVKPKARRRTPSTRRRGRGKVQPSRGARA